jgi:ABC-2 type transport system permease protein
MTIVQAPPTSPLALKVGSAGLHRVDERGIPLRRITGTELRKMFDTRSGFWLMASIVILALLATTAVILFAAESEMTYSSFTAAIGFPMTVVLPIIAILSVTGEWSQRSGLTTFTLVPHRSKVITAKAVACVGVAVVTIPVAFGIGALGNVVGTTIAGIDPVWDLTVTNLLTIVLANVLGMMVGFMLGVVIRSSAGAIVAYFIYSFLLPTLALLLAVSQKWFRDLQPWVDFDHAQSALFESAVTAQQWIHLGVTGVIWLVVPLTVGLWFVLVLFGGVCCRENCSGCPVWLAAGGPRRCRLLVGVEHGYSCEAGTSGRTLWM